MDCAGLVAGLPFSGRRRNTFVAGFAEPSVVVQLPLPRATGGQYDWAFLPKAKEAEHVGFPPRDQSGWDRSDRRQSPPRQSSAAVACRAMVMVACLVGLVGAALFGTALPDLAKGLLDGHWQAGTKSANQSAPEAPPFGSPSSSQWESWPADGSRNAPDWPDGSQRGTTAFAAAPGQAVPEVFHGGEMDRPSAAGSVVPVASPRNAPRMGAVQTSYESWAGQPSDNPATSYEAHPGRVAPSSAGQSAQDVFQPDRLSQVTPRPQPPHTVDRFTYIQTRLRELGATYYLLESWGSDGQYFRFHCRMAVGGSQGYARHFEATESDALQAMARVLEEVESWRGSR